MQTRWAAPSTRVDPPTPTPPPCTCADPEGSGDASGPDSPVRRTSGSFNGGPLRLDPSSHPSDFTSAASSPTHAHAHNAIAHGPLAPSHTTTTLPHRRPVGPSHSSSALPYNSSAGPPAHSTSSVPHHGSAGPTHHGHVQSSWHASSAPPLDPEPPSATHLRAIEAMSVSVSLAVCMADIIRQVGGVLRQGGGGGMPLRP